MKLSVFKLIDEKIETEDVVEVVLKNGGKKSQYAKAVGVYGGVLYDTRLKEHQDRETILMIIITDEDSGKMSTCYIPIEEIRFLNVIHNSEEKNVFPLADFDEATFFVDQFIAQAKKVRRNSLNSFMEWLQKQDRGVD